MLLALLCVAGPPAIGTPIGKLPPLAPSVARAEEMLESGEIEAAREVLLEIVTGERVDATAWLLLGTSYLIEDPRRSRELARGLLAISYRDEGALNLLSAAYERMRESVRTVSEEIPWREQEIGDYEILQARDSDWPEVLYRLASQRLALQRLAPQRTDQIDRAIGELRRLVALIDSSSQADRASAYHQLGRAYKHAGDTAGHKESVQRQYDLAVESFELALDAAPDRVDALGEIVLIHQARKDLSGALEAVGQHQAKVTSPPAAGKVYEMLGSLLLELGRSAEAVTSLRRGLELNDQLMGSYLLLATIFETSGKPDQVEQILNQAVQAEPRFVSGHSRLGFLYMAGGRHPRATRSFERVLQTPTSRAVVLGMEPSRQLYRNRIYYRAAASLAWLYLQDRELDKALERVRQAAKYQPIDAHLMDTLGSVYLERGDPERAIQTFQEIIEARPLPAAHLHLAEIFFQQGRFEDSMGQIDKALGFDSSSFRGRQAAEVLKRDLEAELSKQAAREATTR